MSGPTPKPIRHGTLGGYRTHFRRGETPCEDCKEGRRADARNRYRRRTGSTGYRTGRFVTVPTTVLADLFNNVPIDVQERTETALTRDVIDRAITYYDTHEDTP